MSDIIFDSVDLKTIERCPLCGMEEATIAYMLPVNTVNIMLCGSCGIYYSQKQLTESGLQKFWSGYLDNVHKADEESFNLRQVMYKLDYDFIKDFLKPYSRILDIGCADGLFLDFFAADGHECHGVEFGHDAARKAAQHFRIWEGDFLALEIPFTYDLLVYRGVLQYFQDFRGYVTRAMKLLKDDGLIFITAQPNIDSLCGRIFADRFMLGPNAYTCLGFTPTVLREEFARLGCRLVGEKFFYEETPYANIGNDFARIYEAIEQRKSGAAITGSAPPFFGNMITMVFKKDH